MSRKDPRRLDLRDAKKMEGILPLMSFLFDRYFRVELDGLDNIPKDDPAILFGHHCGSTYTMEGAMLATALFRRDGLGHKLYVMAHRFFYDLPLLGDWLLSMGVVIGNRDVATEVLRNGGQFLVFPGGDLDSHKSYRKRYEVNFHGHTGFIRLSLQERVPLIPFVHVGSHETVFVLASGKRVARFSGLKKRFGLNVFPLVFSLPMGFTLGAVYPAIPFPAKMKIKVMEPVRLWDLGWDDPENEAHLAASLDYLTRSMQGELDALAKARRWPILG